GGSDMPARAALIGVQLGSTEHRLIGADRDDRPAWWFQQPQSAGLVLGEAAVITVRLAGRHDLTEKSPDRRPVVGYCVSHQHDAGPRRRPCALTGTTAR